jgi:cytochrome c peroxidase
MMNWRIIISISFLTLTIFISSFTLKEEDELIGSFKDYFAAHSESLTEKVLKCDDLVKRKSYDIDSAKALLAACRLEYKSIEAFVIYYFPGDARLLNRPIIQEMVEDDEVSEYLAPRGFQYLEQMLYSDSVLFFRKKIRNEVDNIFNLVVKFKESVYTMEFRDRDIFEALQNHLVRQFLLGFAEFETGESRTGVNESKFMLECFKEFFKKAYSSQSEEKRQLIDPFYTVVDAAVEYLNSVKNGKEPDYFKFYSVYYIPISEELTRLRVLLVNENNYNTTAINFQNRSIFDPHAFNSDYFLPSKNFNSKEEVINLGRILFFDPALSANNLRACASCHQPKRAFTDGLQQSQAFEPGKNLTRNSPTIINSVLQRKLFHDGRAFTFQDQAGQVMSNPLEMHSDFSQVAIKLRDSPDYVKLFRAAFIGTEDTIITNRSVLNAISEYERSLIGMNSRFDKTISGRENLLSADEKAGFNIFMGKGNCASCHFIPLFNGLMPPIYVETEWEILGVPSLKKSGRPELDNDLGRASIINVDIFKHAFKTPTLRNIELTGPYMHNGVFRTLEEVIEFYDIGGGIGLGYDVPLQTLPSDSLHLTSNEKHELISFLKSLTDTAYLTAQPTALPEFPGNEILNKRPVGGEY